MNKGINKNTLQDQIMQRVYLIWFLRYLRSSRLVRVVGLAALFVISRFWVSFADVFGNLKGISSFSQYVSVASKNTETAVQVILAFAIFLAALFVFDIGKLISRMFIHPARR